MTSIFIFLAGMLTGMMIGLWAERQARSYYLDRMREEKREK